MRRFAVGDLQGCLQPLTTLLDRVAFDPGRDQLWLVGDLVSRGPDSLETLRFLHNIRDALRITLGNHDLHCLALARGATTRGRHPSLDALLSGGDCERLMDWLRQQPLVYRDPSGDYVMSHAGIPPIWSTEAALAYSTEVQSALQSDAIDDYLGAMYGNEPALWQNTLSGMARLRCITNYLTRMRVLAADGSLELAYKGGLDDIPPPYQPWFRLPPASPRSETQLFGHWAALSGATGRDDCIGLDTGCVWGNCLSMIDLNSREVYRGDCAGLRRG